MAEEKTEKTPDKYDINMLYELTGLNKDLASMSEEEIWGLTSVVLDRCLNTLKDIGKKTDEILAKRNLYK